MTLLRQRLSLDWGYLFDFIIAETTDSVKNFTFILEILKVQPQKALDIQTQDPKLRFHTQDLNLSHLDLTHE